VKSVFCSISFHFIPLHLLLFYFRHFLCFINCIWEYLWATPLEYFWITFWSGVGQYWLNCSTTSLMTTCIFNFFLFFIFYFALSCRSIKCIFPFVYNLHYSKITSLKLRNWFLKDLLSCPVVFKKEKNSKINSKNQKRLKLKDPSTDISF